MPDAEALLSTVAELIDEDTAAQIKALIEQSAATAASQATAVADWRTSLRSDAMYEKYPRVVNALRQGIEEDPADEETLAKMEEKLAKLGVADPRATAAPATPAPPAEPSAQWGQPLEAGSSPPPDTDAALRTAMDQGDMYGVIDGIHQGGKPGKGSYAGVIENYQDWAPLPYRKRT